MESDHSTDIIKKLKKNCKFAFEGEIKKRLDKNEILKKTLVFLNELTKQLESKESEESEICFNNFKAQAIDIWNTWFNLSAFNTKDIDDSKQHPISDMIESNSFLTDIS